MVGSGTAARTGEAVSKPKPPEAAAVPNAIAPFIRSRRDSERSHMHMTSSFETRSRKESQPICRTTQGQPSKRIGMRRTQTMPEIGPIASSDLDDGGARARSEAHCFADCVA